MERDVGGDQGAAAGWALDPELALEGGEPVGEPDEAAAVGPGAADAVVAHPELEDAVLDAREDGGMPCTGVLDDVGQRLGDDEVGGRLDRRRETVLRSRRPRPEPPSELRAPLLHRAARPA